MNKKLKFFLKLITSIAILYFLISTVDINQSIKTLFRINPVVFIVMIVIYLAGQSLSAYKWGLIANQLGFEYNLSKYISYYFTGMFFNLFLPTSVGGDVIKGYYLCRNQSESSKTRAFFSIFADRITGIIVLAFICFAGLFFASAKVLSVHAQMLIILGFLATLLVMFLFPQVDKIEYLKKFSFVNKFNNCIDKIYNKSLIKIFVISLVFHVFMLAIHFCIGRTMGMPIPLAYYLILYPITAIVSFVPISINGIGVREAAYVYLLSFLSINPAQSIVFSLCWFAVMFISSLFSAVFYVKNK